MTYLAQVAYIQKGPTSIGPNYTHNKVTLKIVVNLAIMWSH